MGVPGFFPWLAKYAPKCIQNTLPEGVDTLMIDGNGELHLKYNEYFALLSENETKKSYRERFKENCARFAEAFNRRLTGLMSTFKPASEFYLAIDGVCPMAKMHQQKSRRYTTKFQPEEFTQRTNYCDKNAITPGTKFMHEHHVHLLRFFDNNLRYFPNITRYSSYLEYGEAEHKIFDRLRSGNYRHRRTVIYADDADVIVNALIMPVESLFVARSKQLTIVDIAAARIEITKMMVHADGTTNPFCLFDFVFLTFFLGNDFLPAPLMLINPFSFESCKLSKNASMPFEVTDYTGSLSLVLEVYRQFNINLITTNYAINFSELYRFIEKITLFETKLISFNLNNGILPHKFAEKSIINGNCQISCIDSNPLEPFEYQNLADDEDLVIALFSRVDPRRPYHGNMSIRALYYNSIFSMYPGTGLNAFSDNLIQLAACDGGPYPGKIHSMSVKYLTTMVWVYYYYVSGISKIPNCDYHYPYPIAPMMRDIADTLALRTNFVSLVKTELGKKLNFSTRDYKPYHHALSVLPLWSREVVPDPVKDVMTIIGELADCYPVKFIVFRNNMKQLEQKHAFLPEISVERMLMQQFPDLLSLYEFPFREYIRYNVTYEIDIYASFIYNMIRQQKKYTERTETAKKVNVGIVRRW